MDIKLKHFYYNETENAMVFVNVFESKRDLLYHQNYIALMKAINQAGGNGEFVIDRCASELLDTLARNNIELSAKYLDVPEKSV
jgi:hypothetical protein